MGKALALYRAWVLHHDRGCAACSPLGYGLYHHQFQLVLGLGWSRIEIEVGQ